MKERRDIIDLAGRSPQGVMISLVNATGSSYRRPGARLFLSADGQTAGTISGGCLEADLTKRAFWIAQSGAAVERYDTAFDDTDEIPFGLGCGGAVDLLLEDATTIEASALLDAMKSSLDGQQRFIATVLPLGALDSSAKKRSLERIVMDDRGDVLFASSGLATEDVVAMRSSLLGTFTGSTVYSVLVADVFLEKMAPPQRLIILGAGEDAKPLSTMAAQLGWTVMVADGRAQKARQECFPSAHHVFRTTTIADMKVTSQDAVVLMTHSYEQDRRFLAELLPISPRYLGLLGARHRSALLLSEAARDADLSFEEACSRIFAPVGLDLGGDGPEAIALAILAEAQGVLHQRPITSRGMTVAEALQQIRDVNVLTQVNRKKTLNQLTCAID